MTPTDRATAANPRILRWARERAGLAPDEAGRRLGKSGEDIISWEAGERAPTFVQLEKLASSVYHRPVALFFFPEPPDEPSFEHEFRTLPESDLREASHNVRYELRRAKAFLLSIRELAGGKNPSGRLIWRELSANLGEPVEPLAKRVRDFLGVDLTTQQEWSSPAAAMRGWRNAVEDAGVFVFKDHFGTEAVSGFCLYDSEFPVIMVNNQNTFTRQIFTLFHELAHILYGVNGLTPDKLTDPDRIEDPDDRELERTCNEITAAILVPRESFPLARLRSQDAESMPNAVADVARQFNVSREVILRRLLDAGVVDQMTYEDWTAKWSNQRSYGDRAGGYYYNNQRAYLGQAFLNLAFSRYRAGLISTRELARHLDMRAETVLVLDAHL